MLWKATVLWLLQMRTSKRLHDLTLVKSSATSFVYQARFLSTSGLLQLYSLDEILPHLYGSFNIWVYQMKYPLINLVSLRPANVTEVLAI